ncbi:MAG TPA: serine hydrolase [Puia sp.]|nr:serine hydrolase [Puia sp.]
MRLYPVFFLLFFSIKAVSQPLTRESCLQKIDSIFRSQPGSFALAFKDLSSGKQLFIHEHETFHAASTMKTPVLVEIYRQAAAHLLDLSDSIVLKNEFISIVDSSTYQLDSADDSETELYRHPGEKRSINDLVYQMITVSSNFATNLLIARVGPANIGATLHKLRLDELHVLRGVEDDKAFQKGLNNTVTAAGLASLFEKMAKGRLVSRKASGEMIRILLDQHFNDIIPAGLPAGTKVAHKTGWIKGVHHDSGIVFLANGKKYVLVLLSKDLADDKAGARVLADVSALIYRYATQ